MPNQNNNDKWREEFDETISNVMGIMQIDSLKIKDFIASQISQAKQQGKREGLEEAEEIIANYAEEESESAILKRIRKKFNQLK